MTKDLSCDHELCNRPKGGPNLTEAEVEQVIMCAVEKGVMEVAGINEDGSFRYRLTKEYREE